MQKTLELFQRIATNLLEQEKVNPTSEYISTEKLYETLDLSLKEDPLSEEEFEAALQDLVFATPKTASSTFFNQLFGGRNEKAVLGDLLAVLLNNSMYTYKVAGAQVGVEKSVLSEVCKIIGWEENADGTFASGGSMTNLMSMIMARDAVAETVKNTGVQGKMMVYTSADSHYSIPKNAAFCGIGRNQVRYIKTNKKGQINVLDLARQVEEDIEQGFTPTLVNLTAGTTVLGAFDDVRAVKNICSKYNIWLHLDGAYCGSVLFSRKHRHLIDGVELVDSFSFNAHKMIGTPLTCSLIVVKNKQHLFDSFSNEANYLYQAEDDHFNLGKTSLQCGRRNDALKFWTLWKSVGTVGLEKIVDKQFELADYARSYIENNENYTLHSYEESISVCFNYKGVSAKKICKALYENSEILVGFGNIKNQKFVRLVTINAQNSKEDILSFFTTLESFVDKNMVVKKEAQFIS